MGKRTHRFTRHALYDLVWSEPRTHLAKRLGLSDVGISKACRRASIPMPEPGYWAKKRAGKRTRRPPLPLRSPGMLDEVRLGGNSYWYYDAPSNAEIKMSTPSPPMFDETLESLMKRVRQQVGKVTAPKSLAKSHKLIDKLLDEDKRRQEKQRNAGYPMSWNDPVFDSPIQRRRLRILNALFMRLERCHTKPSVRGEVASELSVQVGQQHVGFTLDLVSAPNRKTSRSAGKVQKVRRGKLRLQISHCDQGREAKEVWEDTDAELLEKQLTDVVVALIVTGERQYRASIQHHYEWLIQRKAELEEEEQRQRDEQVHLEQERRQRREQARVDRLLANASAQCQAVEIRSYVERVVSAVAEGDANLPSVQLDTWVVWALAQADRIDPVQSGRFIEAMKDPAD
jgi:hypothetical protein